MDQGSISSIRETCIEMTEGIFAAQRSTFWRTPKRCSSSTTNSPSCANTTFGERIACVPTITSTSPLVMSSRS